MVVFKDLGIRTILTREAMIISGCGGNASSFTSTEFPLEYPQEQVICCWDEFEERFQNNDEFFFVQVLSSGISRVSYPHEDSSSKCY